MDAILAVAQGSDEPARFIILRHFGTDSSDPKPIVLVGKGVTFDSGGLSFETLAFNGRNEGRQGRSLRNSRRHAGHRTTPSQQECSGADSSGREPTQRESSASRRRHPIDERKNHRGA